MTDFRPSDRVSFHEAGHLVIGLLRGLTPLVVFASEDGGGVFWKGPIAACRDVTMILAGPLAEGFFENWQYRPTDEDLKPWLLAVRSGEKKTADFGKAFTALIDRCGASDRVVMSAFRSAEVEAIDLLDRRDVRAAVRAVATELTRAGRLLGADAAELASRHIEPGSLKMENTP
ncbi:hypothetical protein [Rhizobium laguerreae]|uniref:hypothetical protein n=1 Tax=Rhizobium laguerreae TaxID=1076926 RepID=UPI001C90B9F9|nr:hypothetical protein [Rhizobium laguerreae]MBY3312231.1 hypothetical protein [Rhizobium laguerreae]